MLICQANLQAILDVLGDANSRVAVVGYEQLSHYLILHVAWQRATDILGLELHPARHAHAASI